MGNWSIRFTSDSFHWQHSDVGESGSYLCEDGHLSGTAGAGSYSGRFEPASGTLVWDGLEYR